MRPAIARKADKLTIDHSRTTAQYRGYVGGQRGPPFELATVARKQSAAVRFHERGRAETVELNFVNEVGSVEGYGCAHQPHELHLSTLHDGRNAALRVWR